MSFLDQLGDTPFGDGEHWDEHAEVNPTFELHSHAATSDPHEEGYAMSESHPHEWQEPDSTGEEHGGDPSSDFDLHRPEDNYGYPAGFDHDVAESLAATDKLLSESQYQLDQAELHESHSTGGHGRGDATINTDNDGAHLPVSSEVDTTLSSINEVMNQACQIRDSVDGSMEDYLHLDEAMRAHLHSLSPEERRETIDAMLTVDANERKRDLRERAETGDDEARARLEAWNSHSTTAALEGQVYADQLRNEVREGEQRMRDSDTASQYRIWENESRIDADADLKKAYDRLSHGESGTGALDSAQRELERADYYHGVAEDYDPNK